MPGLERLALSFSASGLSVSSTVICVEDGGFKIDHRWRLTPDWRAIALEVEKWGGAGHARLALERAADGWTVDGAHRPDLDGALEPDLSVTPFCNSLPIRRLIETDGETLTLDACFIDAATMTVTRSRQRYDRLGPQLFRYTDLGLHAGFEAKLEMDDRGLVIRYQNLFERVAPGSWEASTQFPHVGLRRIMHHPSPSRIRNRSVRNNSLYLQGADRLFYCCHPRLLVLRQEVSDVRRSPARHSDIVVAGALDYLPADQRC